MPETSPKVHWKEVACPTCRAKPGEPCGRKQFGVPWVWERTPPHAARKRVASAAPTERGA